MFNRVEIGTPCQTFTNLIGQLGAESRGVFFRGGDGSRRQCILISCGLRVETSALTMTSFRERLRGLRVSASISRHTYYKNQDPDANDHEIHIMLSGTDPERCSPGEPIQACCE